MKKLVLAMACVLSLGLLASCKNGVQDVNVKNANDTEGAAFAGTIALTADAVDGGTTAYTSTTSTTDGFLVGPQHAIVSWKKDVEKGDGNITELSIVFYAKYVLNTGATTTYTYGDSDKVTLKLLKIGDNWYNEAALEAASTGEKSAPKKIEKVEGDPLTGSFTFEGLGVSSQIASTKATISKIVFTKAE